MPYEGKESSIYERMDGLSRTHGDSAPITLISNKPLSTFFINNASSELEELIHHFMGSSRSQEKIKELLQVSEQLKIRNKNLPQKLQGEQSLLTDYLQVLHHNNFNESVFEKFKEEIGLRTEHYMNKTFVGQETNSNNGFNKTLTSLLPYVERTSTQDVRETSRSKRLTKKITEERNKRQQQTTGYELLLYARALDLPVIMNILDERFIPLDQAKKIIHDVYERIDSASHKEKEIYTLIGKKFQHITSFTLSEPFIRAFISLTQENKELRIDPNKDPSSQEKNNYQIKNYA